MPFSGGSGTIGDPYLIATVDDLKLINSYLTSYFKQVDDIDLSDENTTQIEHITLSGTKGSATIKGMGVSGTIEYYRYNKITMTGSSGECDIVIPDLITKTMTFSGDLATTVQNFVTAYYSDYLAVNIQISADGETLKIHEVVSGTFEDFPTATTQSGDLGGTFVDDSSLTHTASTYVATYASSYSDYGVTLTYSANVLIFTLDTPKDWMEAPTITNSVTNLTGTVSNEGGAGWEPIGPDYSSYFEGHYDGNCRTINGLYRSQYIGNDVDYIGLFGVADGASFENVFLTNCDISTLGDLVGALVGYTWNCTIDTCYSTGACTGNVYVGGLVGGLDGSTMDNSYSHCEVSAIYGGYSPGGLVGANWDSNITNCYSKGLVGAGGFTRINGSIWTIYDKITSGIPSDYTTAIFVAPDGAIWVGTLGEGLLKYKNGSWTIYTESNSQLPDDTIECIKFYDDNIYVGTGVGLAIFHYTGSPVLCTVYNSTVVGSPWPSGSNNINDVLLDGGTLWIAIQANAIMKLVGDEWTLYNKNNSDLTNIIPKSIIKFDSKIWFGTKGTGGLWSFDGTTWTEYNSTNSSLPSDAINQIVAEGSSRIWISTMDGVASFDGNSTWNVYNNYNSDLKVNDANCIEYDGDGNVWIGTTGYGVFKYDISADEWTNYNKANSDLPVDDVCKIHASNKIVFMTTPSTNDHAGGFAGLDTYGSPTFTSCYYDSETSGMDNTGMGTPKTTTEMKAQSTYDGWDFTNIWGMSEDNGYPDFSALIGVSMEQAHDLVASDVSYDRFTISWSRGAGDKVVVFVRPNDPIADPVDDTVYTANTVYGSGTENDHAYCVYNGTGTSVTVTGLSSLSKYIIEAYEYIEVGSDPKYILTAGDDNPISQWTIINDPSGSGGGSGPDPDPSSGQVLRSDFSSFEDAKQYCYNIKTGLWTRLLGMTYFEDAIVISKNTSNNQMILIEYLYDDSLGDPIKKARQYPDKTGYAYYTCLLNGKTEITKGVVKRVWFDFDGSPTTITIKCYNEAFTTNPMEYDITNPEARTWYRIPNDYGRCEAFEIEIINATKVKMIYADVLEIGA